MLCTKLIKRRYSCVVLGAGRRAWEGSNDLTIPSILSFEIESFSVYVTQIFSLKR